MSSFEVLTVGLIRGNHKRLPQETLIRVTCTIDPEAIADYQLEGCDLHDSRQLRDAIRSGITNSKHKWPHGKTTIKFEQIKPTPTGKRLSPATLGFPAVVAILIASKQLEAIPQHWLPVGFVDITGGVSLAGLEPSRLADSLNNVSRGTFDRKNPEPGFYHIGTNLSVTLKDLGSIDLAVGMLKRACPWIDLNEHPNTINQDVLEYLTP